MKRVHLMGIGGTGMGALAGLLIEKGWAVRGSDADIYPPASEELERLGVEVRQGYKAENLSPRPDLVVVGNVITRSNPEAQALLASDIPHVSMARALASEFLAGRRTVVVAGTHGKTTTTALLAWILERAGRSPGFFVGGIPLNFGRGYATGSGDAFVVEGDEYDTAFFEKTPKFLHYGAKEAILTSIEFDHADIYRDLSHVIEQFEKFLSILPAEAKLVACGDSETVRRAVSKRPKGGAELYGFAEENLWRPADFRPAAAGAAFRIDRGGRPVALVRSPMLGRQNAANAVAAVAMAQALGVEPQESAEAISEYKGVRRRQEFVGEARGVRIYDDFAHHPTAVEQTLSAFVPLARAASGRLWAVFEPRSNTVRRRMFQEVLPESFAQADEVLLAPVYRKADSLPEAETLSPAEVAASIRKRGKSARAAESHEEILEIVAREARPGDLLLFMSNGSFGGLPRRTLARLQAGSP